jgi:hypothetical protein
MDKRKKLLVLLLCGATLLAACGGSDDGNGETGSTEGGSNGELSAQASEIQTCVADAGFEAEVNETRNFGVEVEYERLTVPLRSEGFDKDYEADIYVFEDAAAMQDNRAAITLNTEDDLRNISSDNVLLNFSIVPDKEHSKALTACL